MSNVYGSEGDIFCYNLHRSEAYYRQQVHYKPINKQILSEEIWILCTMFSVLRKLYM